MCNRECADCVNAVRTDDLEKLGITKRPVGKKNSKNTWPTELYCKEKMIPIYANSAETCRSFNKKK